MSIFVQSTVYKIKMKHKLVTFRNPVKVFQVFTNTNFYTKDEKSIIDRKESLKWETHESLSGYIDNGKLHLNERILDNPDFKNCDLITLNDDKKRNYFTNGKYIFSEIPEPYRIYNECFYLTNNIRLNNNLEIRKAEILELYLLPSSSGEVPKRDSFKLCDIETNIPIEIKLNTKSDFSWSRGTARTFVEYRYIIEYLGLFEDCIILQYPLTPIIKKLPINTKLIDYIKPLW